MYGIPYNAASVLVIDPKAGNVDTTAMAGLGVNGEKWVGGVLAGNGKVGAMGLAGRLTGSFCWFGLLFLCFDLHFGRIEVFQLVLEPILKALGICW